jgi:phosphoribosylanthranilate isomerase
MVAIKFCGITRPEDAAYAASLGAGYVGLIFAGGPRKLTVERATAVVRGLPPAVERVGVFGDQSDEEILRIAAAVGLNVLQLHPAADAVARTRRLQRAFAGDVWPVLRVADGVLPDDAEELASTAGAFLLDAHVPGVMGGAGVTFDWDAAADSVRRLRTGRTLIVAGGLRPTNVAAAIQIFAPDIVDVASGVEQSPGIKDHHLMRAFRDASQGVAADA